VQRFITVLLSFERPNTKAVPLCARRRGHEGPAMMGQDGTMGCGMMRRGGMMGGGGMMGHGAAMRVIFALMDSDGDGTVSL
jgi:hypothetical protein